MAALQTLVLSLQPPAGDRIFIPFVAAPVAGNSDIFVAGDVSYFMSGAMALGAVIAAAVKRRDVAHPEVIVPAYTCPSVVAAVIGAGAIPRLVDLAPESAFWDCEELERSLSDNTVAIIGVNLFGIRQPQERLASAARQADALFIEDDAQGFPELSATVHTRADATIFSFGRGKQLSILGGGAAVLNSSGPAADLGVTGDTAQYVPGRWLQLSSKVLAYNILRAPVFYRAVQNMTFLGIGKTVYKELDRPREMDAVSRQFLHHNLKLQDPSPSKAEQVLRTAGPELSLSGFVDLPGHEVAGQSRRLARYPLLAKDRRARDRVVKELQQTGIGASIMYGRPLPAIDRVPEVISKQGPFPRAEDFSERLFTLPVHRSLTKADINAMCSVLLS